MKPFEHYLTSVEVSKFLRITPVTLRRWRQKGQVKAIKRGNLWFYDWDDITALLTKDW